MKLTLLECSTDTTHANGHFDLEPSRVTAPDKVGYVLPLGSLTIHRLPVSDTSTVIMPLGTTHCASQSRVFMRLHARLEQELITCVHRRDIITVIT